MLLRKNSKAVVELDFISSEQINEELDALLEHYGASESQADLNKTHKILKRFGSITDELAEMHDDKR